MTHTHWHSPSVFRWVELCAWTLAVSGAIAFFTASADLQNTREGLAMYVTDLGKTVLRLSKRAPSPPAAIQLSPEPQVGEAGPAYVAHPSSAAVRHSVPANRHERGKIKNSREWTQPFVTRAQGTKPPPQ